MNDLKSQKNRQEPPVAVFLATTIVVFFCSLSAADSVGLVPNYIDGTTPIGTSTQIDTSVPLSNLPQLGETSTSAGTEPVHIEISAIGLDLPVQNPSTRDIDTLDALLQSGPARFVDSAQLGENGNVLIFAHSSHLPIVHNQMFRAFNKIPNLQAGDQIVLTGADGQQYLYSVVSVVRADASDTTIPLDKTQGKKLTLVTCDTLTGKSARFVLTANFVGIN